MGHSIFWMVVFKALQRFFEDGCAGIGREKCPGRYAKPTGGPQNRGSRAKKNTGLAAEAPHYKWSST
jgi:hypothetical protein